MKKSYIAIILFISTVLITACSKDKDPEDDAQQSVVGKWEVNKIIRTDSKTEVKEEIDDLDIEYKTLEFTSSGRVNIAGYKTVQNKKTFYESTTTYSMTSPYQFEIKTDKQIGVFASLKFDGKSLEILEPGNLYNYTYYYSKK